MEILAAAMVVWVTTMGLMLLGGAVLGHEWQGARLWARWTWGAARWTVVGALNLIGRVVMWPVMAVAQAYTHLDAVGQRRFRVTVGVIGILAALAVYGFLIHNGIIRP